MSAGSGVGGHVASAVGLRSGLKVLVDLGHVLHDALPVGPVRLHQLLHVLDRKEQSVVVSPPAIT